MSGSQDSPVNCPRTEMEFALSGLESNESCRAKTFLLLMFFDFRAMGHSLNDVLRPRQSIPSLSLGSWENALRM